MSTAGAPSAASAPAIHSLIDPAALADLVREVFGFQTSAPPRLIYSGLNDHYSLQTSQGPLVLRVYRHGWRSDDEVGWELALIDHLSRSGAPVAACVPCLDGRWFAEVQAAEGRRQVALFHHAPGPYTHFGTTGHSRISPALCAETFGRSVAEIHSAADSFQTSSTRFSLDLKHLIDRPLAAVAEIYAQRLASVRTLQEQARQLGRALGRHLPAAEWGACHGDMSGGNSTYWQGQVIHFDFDCGGPGWRAYDLGVFYWSLIINVHGAEVWVSFLRGYRAVRPWSDLDEALVPAFAATRILWLMGLWCANAQRFGHQSLHEDYFEREHQRFRSFSAAALQRLGTD